jgi:hypothetical protein
MRFGVVEEEESTLRRESCKDTDVNVNGKRERNR